MRAKPLRDEATTRFAADTAAATTRDATECVPPTTTRDALSLHSIKSFLQQLQVARVANFLARIVDPFLFQRVFGRTVVLVEDGKDLSDGIGLNFEKAY